MKTCILITCLTFIAQVAFGQTDYIVTVKGDTLYGDPKILSYDIMDRVQIKVNNKKVSYTALEVKSIFSKNETYHTVRHNNRYEYMKLLKDGYLSLYGFRIEKQFSYDGRYLVKRDGDAIEVPNLGFKKSMKEFLANCESVSEQISNGELGKKDLDTLIVLYNKCIDQKSAKKTTETSVASSPEALETLRAKIENSTLSSKQDVLDLIKDIDNKVKDKQPIPNYLIDGLKGYLSATEYKDDLDRLIEALPKK